VRQLERPHLLRRVGLEIGERERTTERREILRHRARQVAAVEVAEPRLRQPSQRRGERFLREQRAARRRLAAGHEARREAGNIRELCALAARVHLLARSRRHARLGVLDRILQQPRQRQLSAPALTAQA